LHQLHIEFLPRNVSASVVCAIAWCLPVCLCIMIHFLTPKILIVQTWWITLKGGVFRSYDSFYLRI